MLARSLPMGLLSRARGAGGGGRTIHGARSPRLSSGGSSGRPRPGAGPGVGALALAAAALLALLLLAR